MKSWICIHQQSDVSVVTTHRLLHGGHKPDRKGHRPRNRVSIKFIPQEIIQLLEGSSKDVPDSIAVCHSVYRSRCSAPNRRHDDRRSPQSRQRLNIGVTQSRPGRGKKPAPLAQGSIRAGVPDVSRPVAFPTEDPTSSPVEKREKRATTTRFPSRQSPTTPTSGAVSSLD